MIVNNWEKLPINFFPVSPTLEHKTVLGDLLLQPKYLIPVGKPGLCLGVGPQLSVATATAKELGTGKWSVVY